MSRDWLNAPDAIFVPRHAGVSGYYSEAFHDDDHVVRTLTKILDDATASHRKLDAAEDLQDAHLDDGTRLHIGTRSRRAGRPRAGLHPEARRRVRSGCLVGSPGHAGGYWSAQQPGPPVRVTMGQRHRPVGATRTSNSASPGNSAECSKARPAARS